MIISKYQMNKYIIIIIIIIIIITSTYSLTSSASCNTISNGPTVSLVD